MMDAKLKIAMTALRNITKVPRAEFDMTTVAKIAQTAFCDIDAIAPPVAAGSVGIAELRLMLIDYRHSDSRKEQDQHLDSIISFFNAWGTQQREAGKQEALDLTVSIGQLRQRAEKAEAELAAMKELMRRFWKVRYFEGVSHSEAREINEALK